MGYISTEVKIFTGAFQIPVAFGWVDDRSGNLDFWTRQGISALDRVVIHGEKPSRFPKLCSVGRYVVSPPPPRNTLGIDKIPSCHHRFSCGRRRVQYTVKTF
ncbi:unnamed protein product [Ascophyllum nodosum]